LSEMVPQTLANRTAAGTRIKTVKTAASAERVRLRRLSTETDIANSSAMHPR
jgi:hypothetical protein